VITETGQHVALQRLDRDHRRRAGGERHAPDAHGDVISVTYQDADDGTASRTSPTRRRSRTAPAEDHVAVVDTITNARRRSTSRPPSRRHVVEGHHARLGE